MNPKFLKNFWRGTFSFLLPLMLAFPYTFSDARAAPGSVTRVSVDSSGVQGNAISYSGQISADGRFVTIDSDASNLVADDTNGQTDVFLRNLQLGTTVRVSVDASGGQANGGSGTSAVSADGRYVVFESSASNLVADDNNNFIDIYVKDMQSGAVTRVSVDSSGAQANGNSSYPSISGDGRFVAFSSEASNLVPNDLNGAGDIFVHDLQTGATLWASTNANAGAFDASISLDGRFVVFNSGATNLVANDTNGRRDVFVFAVQTGQITRASVSSSGMEGDRDSLDSSISGDGRYVSFSSASNTFMTNDTFGFTHAYVHDTQTGTTSLVSVINGEMMIGWSDATTMSADGRYIAFSFDDKGDGYPTRWIYIHDRVANQAYLAASGSGTDGAGNPVLASISADGRLLAFASGSASLVAGDTNGVRDIFVKEISYAPDLNPTVTSVAHGCPNGCVNAADQVVDFLVKFSEPVTGVDASDFVLTLNGGIAGAAVTTVSGERSDYIVRVDTGTGDGTLRLDIVDDDSIKDFSLNPLGGAGAGNGGFTAGEIYKVDKNVVAVASILRLDPSPSPAASVRFAVNFSEPVTGVDVSDFMPVTTGSMSGVTVTEVSGSGSIYTITVNTGAGEGTLRLDLLDDDSILDFISIPLGGFGVSTGNYSSGETYTIDRYVPFVVSILRMDPHPTAAAVVHFSVTFSEPVSGVDGSDFMLTTGGVTGAAMTELFVSGNTYYVTVNTGSGNGSVRLDVVDNDSILDAAGYPLGGVGAGNGSFVFGETYTITKITYIMHTERYRSNGSNDGWILESKEDSNQGYAKNSTASTFNLGDNATDRQYRAILSFPTASLPDDAIITKVILMLRAQGVVGTDPFTTHGNITIDIRTGPFSSFGPFRVKALQPSDFQATASRTSVGIIQNNPVDGWYWALLDSSAFPYVNVAGVTQFRLAFQLDDNDDFEDDYIMFFSGDYKGQAIRPHLVIEYNLKK
ncbi:MAG: PD40 domain-containing protein [Anaerolineales bacterium]|nr:PD40 domain-containing protein [Anaerolineales bacterium]